jgi:hypothetical protein
MRERAHTGNTRTHAQHGGQCATSRSTRRSNVDRAGTRLAGHVVRHGAAAQQRRARAAQCAAEVVGRKREKDHRKEALGFAAWR